jgi:hypothetical protein
VGSNGWHYHKRDRRWNANLRMNGTSEYLGSFKNRYQAMHAVIQKRKELGLPVDDIIKKYKGYQRWLKDNPEDVKIVEEKIENLKKIKSLNKAKKKKRR